MSSSSLTEMSCEEARDFIMKELHCNKDDDNNNNSSNDNENSSNDNEKRKIPNVFKIRELIKANPSLLANSSSTLRI